MAIFLKKITRRRWRRVLLGRRAGTCGLVPRPTVSFFAANLLAVFVDLGVVVIAGVRTVGVEFQGVNLQPGVVLLELFVVFPVIVFLLKIYED